MFGSIAKKQEVFGESKVYSSYKPFRRECFAIEKSKRYNFAENEF
jgi:hypothetical protein